MVGWNIAPPPPGPIIWKFPGRGPVPLVAIKIAKASWNKNNTVGCFSLLSLPFLRFLFGRNALLCQLLLPVDLYQPVFQSYSFVS
jgi:hypothetical protein